MAGATVVALHRCLAIGRQVLAVMTAETAVPILVAHVIGMGPPIGLHLGKEILMINFLRDANDRLGHGAVRISFSQRGGNPLVGLGSGGVWFDEGSDDFG